MKSAKKLRGKNLNIINKINISQTPVKIYIHLEEEVSDIWVSN